MSPESGYLPWTARSDPRDTWFPTNCSMDQASCSQQVSTTPSSQLYYSATAVASLLPAQGWIHRGLAWALKSPPFLMIQLLDLPFPWGCIYNGFVGTPLLLEHHHPSPRSEDSRSSSKTSELGSNCKSDHELRTTLHWWAWSFKVDVVCGKCVEKNPPFQVLDPPLPAAYPLAPNSIFPDACT